MTKMVPGLVSVVMPNRNHAHYLPTSLDAILAQTWQNLEIVVIDDASSDNSRDVIEKYAARDPRIRPLYVVENLGVNRAVEAARAYTRGEFLCTAAADDFVAPTFFAASVGQLVQFPDAGLCFSDPTEYYEANARSFQYPLYLNSVPTYYDPETLQSLIKRNHFSISSNTIIYRAKAFSDAGGYRAELGWLSDWFVTLVIALRHGACYLPDSLTSYRVRQDSFSALMAKNLTAQRQQFDFFISLVERPEYADVAAAMHAAAILPEYRARTLYWLCKTDGGRKFLSPHLFKQILYKSVWSLFRPFAPSRVRQKLRKWASRRASTRNT